MNEMMSTMATGVRGQPDSLDEETFPRFGSLSAGLLFQKRVLVYSGAQARLEFITVPLPTPSSWHRDTAEVLNRVALWNAQWEGGPHRAFETEGLPAPLRFLDTLEGSKGSKGPPSDIVLIPISATNIYEEWAPLYHLLPRSMLAKHQLPVIKSGVWPLRGYNTSDETIHPDQRSNLETAFAQHLWSNGLGRAKSPLIAFSDDDPLKLLAHDLAFWRAHMERLLREHHSYVDRMSRAADDLHPTSSPTKVPELTWEMPRKGTILWEGEHEAAEMMQDLIDLADDTGRLRAVIDAIRSHRVEEDFSARWSAEREDFERKLYKKRNKVQVSFVELGESIPYFDCDAELDGNMLFRNLFSVVDVKDRRVIVCMHRGLTGVNEIAAELGYANHSPVSKALSRIRAKAEKLLK